MRAAPAVSCAVCTKSAHTSIQVKRRTSDIPCAMALRLITCSPRRTALLPPLRPEKLLPPGALTPAPRRQDHTSLPYALMPFAIGTACVHRDPPHDRGDHDNAPLVGTGWVLCSSDFNSDKAKYFLLRGLTRIPKIGTDDLPVGSITALSLRWEHCGSIPRQSSIVHFPAPLRPSMLSSSNPCARNDAGDPFREGNG